MLIHFTSERGKPLYNSKNDPEMAGPKVSITEKEVPMYTSVCVLDSNDEEIIVTLYWHGVP